MKKTGPLVAGAAVAFATVIAVAPTASADTPVTQDKVVAFTCTGTSAANTITSPNTFKVTYPEIVAPGEVFTVSVQPGEMRNNDRPLARMTFDYALPTTGTILDLKLAGGEKGLGGVAPSVTRVTAAKTTSAAGPNARIWGGVSARYGSSSSTSSTTGGITVAANTDFQLPTLEIVLRAPAQVGQNVTVGLPGANMAHTGNGSAQSTDLQWTRSGPTSAEQCSSTPEAATLTTTTVGDLPSSLLPSSTTIASSLSTVGPHQPIKFSSNVTAQYGTAAVAQGKVEFWSHDVKLGEATPNAAGLAELNHTFAPIVVGQPDQILSVEARYLGVNENIAASTSAPVAVTNTGNPTVDRELRFDLRAQLGSETAEEVPVTINATIGRPTGTTVPDEAMVQLFRGDTPVGEPVALPAGNQMTWTDTIARQPRTTTERYRVEFVTPVISGYEKWNSASQPVSVIVNGSDPSLNPPITGDTGSLDMVSILGSLGNMFGTGS